MHQRFSSIYYNIKLFSKLKAHKNTYFRVNIQIFIPSITHHGSIFINFLCVFPHLHCQSDITTPLHTVKHLGLCQPFIRKLIVNKNEQVGKLVVTELMNKRKLKYI